MNASFIEVGHWQKRKNGETALGDTFLSWKGEDRRRTISVLSDGLGSGVKAGVLSSLSATMALSCIRNNISVKRTAEIIYETLPVCRERQISYATFTIVDIQEGDKVKIMEYDNPSFLLIRNGKIIRTEQEKLEFSGKSPESICHHTHITSSCFTAQPGDRIIIYTDGVSQSGLGTRSFPLGFGEAAVSRFIQKELEMNSTLSARDLARKVVISSEKNDLYKPLDDISCAVLYFREPRKLLLVSGPPYHERRDEQLAEQIRGFRGTRILCGGTTATIVSRIWNEKVFVNLKNFDPQLPPPSSMKGVDLVTEGIITLAKVSEFLETGLPSQLPLQNPAGMIIEKLINSDIIHFIAGTRINEAHQDPNMPVELEIRRNIIKKIGHILEEKYLKEVHIEYI